MKKYVIELVDGLFATHLGCMSDNWDEIQLFDTENDAEVEMYRIEDSDESNEYNCKVREVELTVKLL